MNRLASVFLGLSAMAVSGSALSAPHDPGIFVGAVATPDVVTLSRAGLPTSASYVVTIENNTRNALNWVAFQGTALVDNSLPATFDATPAISLSGPSPNCLASANSVNCTIGSLMPGTGLVFVVVVNTPTAGSSINFTSTFTGSEGNSTNGCCTVMSSTSTTLVDALTSPEAKANVRSFVKPAGGTFFTGNGSFASPADPFTTKVSIPVIASYTSAQTAAVQETPLSLTNAPNCSLKTCFQSAITIPGTFSPSLTIVLSQDASQINPGTKIESVLIQYQYLDEFNVTQTYNVGICASPMIPRTDGLPCIASRVAYKNKTVLGWTADRDGDFEWTLLNIKNGTYKPGF